MHKSMTLVLVLAGSLFFSGIVSADEYKIGFVSTERLFRDSEVAKQAQQKLEAEFLKRENELKKLSDQVQALQTEIDRDGTTMAENTRRDKERDLTNASRDLQRQQREFREDLNLRRNEELSALQERANKVIQKIAENDKFDLILQEPVVYASKRIDITDQVIKALDTK